VPAELSATLEEAAVGSLRARSEYDPLPALRRYAGPTLSVETPVNFARYGQPNFVADLPHAAFTGACYRLWMDRPEESVRILDRVLAPVRVAGALRSREPGK
jgi:hypothetical protein